MRGWPGILKATSEDGDRRRQKVGGGLLGGWEGGVVDLTRLTVGCWTACDLVLFWLFLTNLIFCYFILSIRSSSEVG